MAGARTQPVVLALEDVHWADPTTLDFIRGIVERGALAPLLLLITARPEFRPAWAIRSHHATISLAPLDRSQVREMVAGLSARHALPKQIVDGVTERTGGVPLFIEEVTRLLLERGEQGGTQAIPPTLQQSLLARLDRLGPAREVAQIAAVIGRDFSYGLLRAVAGMDEATVQAALDRLTEADILLVQGSAPQSEYRFKHALIQDAAYENLLKSRRQSLHRRIGEVLREQFTVAAAAEPELLAHHFSRAGVPEAAVEWWGKAGQQSLERSALMEATEQLTRALDLITKLPATAALRREEIKLQAALLTPLLNIKGYAAPETKAAVQRARLLIEQAETLGEPPEDQLLLFSVLYVFWTTNYVAFNCDVCLELAAHFLKLAEQQEASAPVMVGHRLVAMSLLYAGHIAQGREHCDQAITLYDTTEHRALATRFGADSRVSALAVRALAMWVLGYPDMACSDAIHAVSDARQIGQAASLMYALVITSLPLILSGSYAAAAPNLDEALVLADATSSLNWRAFGMCDQGCLLALAGKTADAVPTIIAGVAAWRSVGATLNVPLYLAYLAKAHAELDQMDDASRCIGEAMTTIHATGERWCEAEVHRTAGEIALLSSELDAAKAEGYFQRALAVARQQQAKSWELRASMSLARLWRDQGKPQRARELLAPVYGWFTEGFDTRDLKEAKTLLEQLAI
jgi:predicted ATPase